MEGLEKVCSEANALHVLLHAQTCSVSEEALQSLITMEENVESVEVRSRGCWDFLSLWGKRWIYFIAHSFDLQNATSPYNDKISQFFEAITWVRNKLIWFLKKPKAKETEFWKTQRTRRITASNVYKICHFRDSTIKDNTLKGRFNNCPSGVMWRKRLP